MTVKGKRKKGYKDNQWHKIQRAKKQSFRKALTFLNQVHDIGSTRLVPALVSCKPRSESQI